MTAGGGEHAVGAGDEKGLGNEGSSAAGRMGNAGVPTLTRGLRAADIVAGLGGRSGVAPPDVHGGEAPALIVDAVLRVRWRE